MVKLTKQEYNDFETLVRLFGMNVIARDGCRNATLKMFQEGGGTIKSDSFGVFYKYTEYHRIYGLSINYGAFRSITYANSPVRFEDCCIEEDK